MMVLLVEIDVVPSSVWSAVGCAFRRRVGTVLFSTANQAGSTVFSFTDDGSQLLREPVLVAVGSMIVSSRAGARRRVAMGARAKYVADQGWLKIVLELVILR
jgi:hypothetical protein